MRSKIYPILFQQIQLLIKRLQLNLDSLLLISIVLDKGSVGSGRNGTKSNTASLRSVVVRLQLVESTLLQCSQLRLKSTYLVFKGSFLWINLRTTLNRNNRAISRATDLLFTKCIDLGIQIIDLGSQISNSTLQLLDNGLHNGRHKLLRSNICFSNWNRTNYNRTYNRTNNVFFHVFDQKEASAGQKTLPFSDQLIRAISYHKVC